MPLIRTAERIFLLLFFLFFFLLGPALDRSRRSCRFRLFVQHAPIVSFDSRDMTTAVVLRRVRVRLCERVWRMLMPTRTAGFRVSQQCLPRVAVLQAHVAAIRSPPATRYREQHQPHPTHELVLVHYCFPRPPRCLLVAACLPACCMLRTASASLFTLSRVNRLQATYRRATSAPVSPWSLLRSSLM